MIFRCFGFLLVACFACLESSSKQAASFTVVVASASVSAADAAPQTAQAPLKNANQATLVFRSQGPQVVEVTGIYGESTAVFVSKLQKSASLPQAAIAQTQAPKKAQISTRQTNANPSQPAWLLPGIVGSLALVGGFTVVALMRRKSADLPSEIPQEKAADTESHLEEASEPRLLKTEEATISASPNSQESGDLIPVEGNFNGYSHSAASISDPVLQKEPIESPMSYVAETSKVSETTRLAKINIVDELIRDLRTPDPTKRHKVIWELGQRGDTRAVQPLVDLMIDSDSKQRSLILSSLSEIGTRTLKPLGRALAISLQDESPDVRKNAIRDLTRVYDMVAQISHLLHQASDDPDNDVQETARWALGQLNRIRSAPTIELPAFRNSVSPPESLP